MAKSGFGTTLEIADAATGIIWAILAGVTNITPFNITRETLDSTNMGTADGFKTVIGGLKDSGECTVDINYDPTAHNALLDDFDEPDPMKYRVTFPGVAGEIASFDAIMTSFAPSSPMEDKLTASIGLKISGKIVWT